MTYPDPNAPGPEQDAIQPPPDQGYGQPPNQGYNQPPPGQSYDPPPPHQGFAPAPPVPAGYGYGQYPAGAVPQGMYFDQASGLMLPDGTQLASVGRRIGAYFLAIPLIIVTLGIGYIIWGLIAWGSGQTPTLQVLGMRVWHPEGQQVASFWRMALRETIGRLCDSILGLITEVTSFVLFVAGKEHKAIHDYVASTVVLRDPNKVLSR